MRYILMRAPEEDAYGSADEGVKLREIRLLAVNPEQTGTDCQGRQTWEIRRDLYLEAGWSEIGSLESELKMWELRMGIGFHWVIWRDRLRRTLSRIRTLVSGEGEEDD